VAKAPDQYAGESVVLEHSDVLYAMNADGTGYREQSVVARVQSEAAVRQLGILGIGFASASEHVEIEYARVRRPDGTVIETPVSGALEQPQPVTREAPFYSDLKQMQLPIKSLRAGDVLEWKIKVIRTKAEAPGQFWGDATFIDDGVVLSQTLELRFPTSAAVKVWTNPAIPVKPVESIVGEQHIYRWQTANLKPTTGPEAEAEKKRKKQEIWTAEQELDAKEGKLPAVAWTTFKSWEEVGGWYRGLEADRMVPDAMVKEKVRDLTQGLTTTEAKARGVYGFVGPQVRYVGVAFGVGRYQPHSAAEVLQNQYGDCKDKHTLLAAMLGTLGLHPDAVLIGGNIRFNEEVPSPAAFNHLITRVVIDGQETWLDSTAEVAPYRMLSSPIRDKRALAIPESGPAVLVRSPASPPFASYQAMRVEGTLSADGVEVSHVTIASRGDAELFLREVLHQLPPAQYDEFAQKFWRGIGFAGTTSHAEFSRPEATDEPMKMEFDDRREKAGGEWENYRVVAQLMAGALPEVDEKDPPVQAIELGFPQTMTSSFLLKLPEGWSAELPEAIHNQTDFAKYDLTYHLEKGTVSAERTVAILKEKVPVNEWKAYKKWIDDSQVNSFPYIQLTKVGKKGDAPKKGSGAAAAAPAASSGDEDAAKLVQEAFVAMRSMNVTDAEPLLNRAKALNDKQKLLWAGYGYLATLRGASNEALEDYHKELALHPDAYAVYPSIVYSQMQSRKRADAMATLHDWAAADPSDPSPSIQLSAMQLADGKADAAYETMVAAIANLPEEKRQQDNVLLALTNAEMKNGMQAKAAATLVELLKTTDDALTLNDAAYSLSDANLELPAAEAAERKALAKMDAETASWTLEESPALLKQKTSLLAASWDTMGWILFREGKLDESRSYVEAAWHNRGDAVVGEHLGDIQMAQHRSDLALTSYELAKKSGGPVAELDAKQAAARKAGGKAAPGGEAAAELVKVRTIKLGPAQGRQGAAEYRMLIANGKVELSKPATEKQITGATEMLRGMKAGELFPSGSAAKLAKTGILNCHAGECEMVFEP
jgi:hypothetical protein